ncbi:MFS general substrate transporter [Amylocystis lapponica]|nr:MFS general substrate transporter [Amylocystis lapponica]
MASSRMSYYSAVGADDDDLEFGVVEPDDGRTPLDKTIDRIGMGWYQWTLLSLCGFGWMADNMWIQAIAIVLPRVQQHFSVGDSSIGILSSSMFAGMMFGAVGWGTCSDLMGRTTAFNATLFLTSVFGIFASFANTFVLLCLALFFLGSAVGGSMPTDGTLLLEHMPNGKQYLVTALSVFFSFGAVLAAVVGLLVIPGHSCPPAPAPCDETQNWGWKYLLIALGLITLSMFIARMVFFRLHESPRYLVHAGRPQEALESLQLISRFNGSELSLDLDDVQDHLNAAPSAMGGAPSANTRTSIQDNQIASLHPNDPADVLFDAEVVSPSALDEANLGVQYAERYSISSQRSHDVLHGSPDSESKNYSSTGESTTPLDVHVFGTPTMTPDPRHVVSFYSIASHDSDSKAHDTKDVSSPASLLSANPSSAHLLPPEFPPVSPRPRPGAQERSSSRNSGRQSTAYEVKSKVYWRLPRWIRRPLWAWLDRVAMVLSPEWLRTTLLMWGTWWAMSLAYTMFNVYLPKLLEARGSLDPDAAPKTLEESLRDVVIYALGGCPGAILGAYLIDSPLGRRWALAGSTFVTAFFCWVFVLVEQPWAVRASTVGISLSATAMYAVLYGWTPEIFGTKVRGTACGIASALSRIGGMIAPMLGGKLLSINSSVPVYTSIVVFLFAGICVLFLEEKEGTRSRKRAIVH